MLANCDDPALREIVQTFFEAEKGHEEFLLAKYNTLRQTDEFKD